MAINSLPLYPNALHALLAERATQKGN